MKKDLKTRLVSRKISPPNGILMSIGMWVQGILNRKYKVEFSYDYDRKAILDQATVLLSSHASRLEFIYAIYGFGRKDINVVCGFQNIIKWTLASEEIHNLYDDRWKSACEDVYEYHKGDLLCDIIAVKGSEVRL